MFLCFLLRVVVGLLFLMFTAFILSLILDMEIYVQLNNIFLGLFISFIVGIISGVAPSYQAAKLNPVDAIRK
jgi:putative ABC transport system permease protein